MESLRVYKIRDIDINSIVYSKPKGKDDKRVILLSYFDKKINKKVPFIFQTPDLCNINEVEMKNKNSVLCELNVPLFSKTSSKTKEIIDFLNALDNKFLEDGSTNSEEW